MAKNFNTEITEGIEKIALLRTQRNLIAFDCPGSVLRVWTKKWIFSVQL